jgi:hypothetical protein
MSQFTVYLFMRSTPYDTTPAAAERRLGSLQAVRDELLALDGISVSAVPAEADLLVEITSVRGLDDGPAAGRDERLSHRPSRQRILIVRLTFEEDRLDFVCSDGGNVTAERQAARRIRAWLTGSDRYQGEKTVHVPTEWAVSLSTSC